MFAPDVTPADDCCVVTVGVLQFENAIGPAKSFSTEVNEGDDRVCGRKVLMQPVNPAAARSMPPSMKAFIRMVEVPVPLESRQTQPPQVMPAAGVLTPNEETVLPPWTIETATYCGS